MSEVFAPKIPFHISAKKQLKALARFRDRKDFLKPLIAGKKTAHSERTEKQTLRYPNSARRAKKRSQHLTNLAERRAAQHRREVWPGIGRHAGITHNRKIKGKGNGDPP